MRIFIPFIISIALLLTSCTSASNQPTTQSPEPEPVSFHHYFSGRLSGGLDDMVHVYNASQSDYELKAVPIDHEAYKINILESFNNKTPSDLNSYWAGAKANSIIEYLEPLDDVFLENDLHKNFSPSLIASSSLYGDSYYLLPITQHYVCFYYNKEVFERLELSEPTNWDEFLNVCSVLSANEITPIGLGAKNQWPAQFWFDYLLLRTAGYDYRHDLMNGKASYTDDEVKYAIALWKDLIDQDYFNSNSTYIDWDTPISTALMNGNYGMTLMGTWFFAILDAQGYEGQYDVFSFPVVTTGVPSVSLGPVDGVIIGRDAINIEGAKEAIVQLSSTDNQSEMAIGSGGFAPNINVPTSIYTPLQLELLETINQSNYWAFNYDLATDPALADYGLDFFTEFLVFPDAYEFLLEDLQSKVDNR